METPDYIKPLLEQKSKLLNQLSTVQQELSRIDSALKALGIEDGETKESKPSPEIQEQIITPIIKVESETSIVRIEKHIEAEETDNKFIQNNSEPEIQKVLTYFDGGCRGNGQENAQMYGSWKIGSYNISRRNFGIGTNNRAEYLSFIGAIEESIEKGIKAIAFISDSQLVVNQMNGTFRVKDTEILELYKEANSLLAENRIDWSIERVDRNRIVKVLGH